MSTQPVKRGIPARDQFINAVLADRNLGGMAVRVGARLGMYLNCTHGQCDPGYPTIAEALGVSERSVIRAVAELAARGWIEVDRADGRVNNKFRLFMIETDSGNRVTAVVTPDAHSKIVNRVTDLPVWGDKNAAKNANRVTTAVTQNNEKENIEKENKAGLPPAALVTPVVTEQQTDSKTLLVSEAADAAPIAPALSADDDIKQARETAHKAARLSADGYLHHEQRPEFSLDAASFQGMGHGTRRNGGLLIDETGNVINEIETPPPKARARTYAEAIYGDSP
jgi:hypothetical protein